MVKVAVLMGGDSAEREVSLKSGAAVLSALQRQGVNAQGYDLKEGGLAGLERLDPTVGFIALHGRGGEDGALQGALELLGLPYTGSGVLASALGMDKQRTKQVWQAVGLPTPECIMLNAASDWEAVVAQLGLPMMVKPVHEGSTLGISIVRSHDELKAAYAQAATFDARVMAERFITGDEYTVGLLGAGGTRRIRPAEVPVHLPRVHLPRETEAIRQPSAPTRLASRGQRLPVPIDLGLVCAIDLKRDRRREAVHRPAVQREERCPVEREADGEHAPRRSRVIVARRAHEGVAEMPEPRAIRENARGERIVFVGDSLREIEAAADLTDGRAPLAAVHGAVGSRNAEAGRAPFALTRTEAAVSGLQQQ